jgi:hypothetical protein
VKEHTPEQLKTWAKAFAESEFGLYVLDNVRRRKDYLLNQAMSEDLTVEQKALRAERAGGVSEILDDLTYIVAMPTKDEEGEAE